MIETIYRVLLWLTPRGFRDRFGDELLDTARAYARDHRGISSVLRAIVDAVLTIIALHADFRAEARRTAPQPRATSMDSLIRDVRFALRGLRREPAFALFVALTFALGIGSNAAMFGIADRLLLRGPEHVREPDRVMKLFATVSPKGMNEYTTNNFGHVEFDLLRAQSGLFDGVAQYSIGEAVENSGADARSVQVGWVSAALFPLLGVQPVLGRFFSDAEDTPNAAQHVIVLSHAMWQANFNGSRSALGKSVVVNNEPYTVVGVAPRGFTGPELGRVDYWVPVNLIGPRVTKDWTRAWNAEWLEGVVRVKAGVSPAQLSQLMSAAHKRAYTGSDSAAGNARLFVAPLSSNESGKPSADTTVVVWLTGVALLVLLIACANVANLLIARGMRRAREMAIRSALGASRFRVVRLLLLESLVLSLGGAAIGIAIAYVLGALARATLFTYVDWYASPVNGRVLAMSVMLAVIVGLLVGLLPATRIGASSLTSALKSGARDGGGRRSALRTALTIAQAALSVALLIGAGLFVKSLWRVRSLDLGIEPARVLMVGVSRTAISQFPEGPERDAERARRRAFLANAIDAMARVPGVKHASVAAGLPFQNRFTIHVRVPGRDSIPRLSTGIPGVSAVSSDYFATVGTSILRGRGFTTADRAGSERVAIVSETMAKTVWPNANPIGQCLIVGEDTMPCTTVVGVAEDTRRSRLREDPSMHYYLPLGQEIGFGGSILLLSGPDDPRALIPAVQRAMLALDPTVTYVDPRTLQEAIDPQMRPWKLGASVFAMSGILALLVAAVGIYSVMSYLIADRRHEIGVRMALGADGTNITALVLRGSLVMAVVGVLIGELLATVAGGFIQPLLFETSARDLSVFGAVGVLLVSVALLATLVPAMRARSVSPIEALRAE